MKKLFFCLLCSFAGLLNAYSQSGMTSEEMKFRNGIEQFLKEEGYSPTIDNRDNSLNFKKGEEFYWLTVDGDRPYYIQFHIDGYTFKKKKRKLILEACNYAKLEKRCGKAWVKDDKVGFTIEFYCISIEGFKHSFIYNIRALTSVKKAVLEYYGEHE